MAKETDKKNINDYLEKVGANKQPTLEEYKQAVTEAIKDRGRIYYFIWKTIKELHPEIDADEIMEEASRKFGSLISSKFKKVDNAKDAMIEFSSKVGILAFDQEFIELNEDRSVKKTYKCPHMDAFKELGCSDEEMEKLCDMLSEGDFAQYVTYPNVKLTFKSLLSRGQKYCEPVFTKEKNK